MLRALYRSTAIRLIAPLGLAFMVFLLLAGLAAFLLTQAELNDRMRQQLEQTFAVITQSYAESDLTDLTELVRSHAAANPHEERVFLLRSGGGQKLAGNIDQAPGDTGWAVVPGSALGLDADDSYQIYSGLVANNTLVVGASFEENDAVGAIVRNSLGVAGIAFILLIVMVGLVIAIRGQRRIDGIAATMDRVGRGDLASRIPLRGNHDDLDDLSAQINQALDRLAGLVEGMRQVSVDIAHDLKTPLNRLSFIVQNAIDDDEAGKPVADLLQQAQEESHQINTTFDALLRIAQIESGARRARFKAMSIQPVLETLYDAYEEVAQEHGQTLVFVGTPLPTIVGDRDLLTQLFANLIENAIRHCPPGTQITLAAASGPDQVFSVIVSDTGPGIPETERERVFQRLYRLDKSRSTPGHGLGLSLVKAIADLHGASIAVEDNKPGLCITVRFVPQAETTLGS
ncbi:HAMP domain-containing histidine kinase [Devosia sp. BK]|uniref:HAMP domain-containing sensor histidine kinase n=1 Tax=Devosia sp. BK TaxID=2871706 RepID=UPI00293B8546|nr:HAMP domain-containing sensor histidine kinase [Devosia sp. BK]MDV3251973.1 HAMP domain-containing histidine kinase [Devosia sp. BK]